MALWLQRGARQTTVRVGSILAAFSHKRSTAKREIEHVAAARRAWPASQPASRLGSPASPAKEFQVFESFESFETFESFESFESF